MAQVSLPVREEHWGQTSRRDLWWLGPLLVALGLTAFLVYGTWAAWQGGNFEIRKNAEGQPDWNGKPVAPYLSPFFSPLIYDPISPHAWSHSDWKSALGLPAWFPFSAGFLILAFPGLFRFTCYYYRKAYYRAFWQDPPACAVGEPRKSYRGENHWPLLFQNAHRYALYIAIIFLFFLWWDALYAFYWPTLDANGYPTGGHQFGMGLGTLVMLVNVVLLTGFTLGCNSLRHLVGGRLDCFSCPNNVAQDRGGYKVWRFVSRFNEHHMLWAWLSLFSVGFTDVYIRLCSTGVWHDVRFF
ncbi:MAG TPA: hypothetical protein VFA26_00955 [Gemmataceae bacterium]|nr:hypothetical protein [Gemmataceae bacterium]